jgi:hypothetical protein
MSGCIVTEQGQYTFELKFPDDSVVALQADSENDYRLWLDALVQENRKLVPSMAPMTRKSIANKGGSSSSARAGAGVGAAGKVQARRRERKRADSYSSRDFTGSATDDESRESSVGTIGGPDEMEVLKMQNDHLEETIDEIQRDLMATQATLEVARREARITEQIKEVENARSFNRLGSANEDLGERLRDKEAECSRLKERLMTRVSSGSVDAGQTQAANAAAVQVL